MSAETPSIRHQNHLRSLLEAFQWKKNLDKENHSHAKSGGSHAKISFCPYTDQSNQDGILKDISKSEIHPPTDDIPTHTGICVLLTALLQTTTCSSAYCRIAQ